MGFDYNHIPDNHYFIAGNHDNYENMHPNGIIAPQYHQGIYCIPGASSIDRNRRTMGVNWFPQEELSYPALVGAIRTVKETQPKFIASHDCPSSVAEELFDILDHSKTRIALQAVLEACKPTVWIFGHHHKSVRKEINGCLFICLDELECYELNHTTEPVPNTRSLEC